MNFLSMPVPVEASPICAPISEIARLMASRDGVLGSYRRAVGWTDESRELRGVDRSYLLFGH
jgi:hypothetical protein